jgi:hypothetical protein
VRPEGQEERAEVTATVSATTWKSFAALMSWVLVTEALIVAVSGHALSPVLSWVARASLFAAVAYAAHAFRRCRSIVDALRVLNIERSGKVRVTEEAMLIGDMRVVRRSDLVVGLVRTLESGAARLLIRTKRGGLGSRFAFGLLSIELPSPEAARALARTLGTDVSRRTADFPVTSPLALRVRLAVLALVLASCVAIGFLVQVLPLAGLFGFVALVPLMCATLVLSRTVVRVGTDGVERRQLGLRRFTPYRDIEEVRQDGFTVVLVLKDGTEVRYFSGETAGSGTSSLRERMGGVSMLASRLREAMQAYRSGVADDGVAWLARGDRSEDEWVRALRSIGSGDARSYRAAPPTREALWRFVEDPAADEAVRQAAAIALGATASEGERDRLRVAARVTVAPKLRAVLEREADAHDLDDWADPSLDIGHEGDGARRHSGTADRT